MIQRPKKKKKLENVYFVTHTYTLLFIVVDIEYSLEILCSSIDTAD